MCARTQHAQINNLGKGNGNQTSESIQPGQILLRKNIQRLQATPSLNISKKLAKTGASPSFGRQVSTQNQDRERTNRTQEQAISQHSQLSRKPSEMQETKDKHVNCWLPSAEYATSHPMPATQTSQELKSPPSSFPKTANILAAHSNTELLC